MRGSRPATNGVRKIPAARNEAAVQNRASCRCQVRARLNGRSRGEVEAEEAQDVGPVVLGRGAQQRLDQKQRRDREEEPGRRALGRGQGHLAGLAERDCRGLRAVPADLGAPAAVDREQDAGAAEQHDERQDAPHHHVCRRAVVHPRLGRPVVGVGVGVAGPFGRRRPRGPGEERRELANLRRVADHVRDQPVPAGVHAEELSVVRWVLASKALAWLSVKVRVPVASSYRLVRNSEITTWRGSASPGLRAAASPRSPSRGAGSPRCSRARGRRRARRTDPYSINPRARNSSCPAVMSAPVKSTSPLAADDLLRLRHRGGVGPVGEDAHHEETEDHDEGDGLHPALPHHELASIGPGCGGGRSGHAGLRLGP